MVKKYVFVRMPNETYNLYKRVQANMEKDMSKVTGRRIPLPMTKVFKAVISPEFNENFIQVDINKLTKFARQKI